MSMKQIQELLNNAKISYLRALPAPNRHIYICVKTTDVLQGKCGIPAIIKAFFDQGIKLSFAEKQSVKANPLDQYRNPAIKWFAFRA